ALPCHTARLFFMSYVFRVSDDPVLCSYFPSEWKPEGGKSRSVKTWPLRLFLLLPVQQPEVTGQLSLYLPASLLESLPSFSTQDLTNLPVLFLRRCSASPALSSQRILDRLLAGIRPVKVLASSAPWLGPSLSL